MSNTDFYKAQIQQHELTLEAAKSKFRMYTFFRLLIFSLAAIFIIYFGIQWISVFIFLAATILFLWAVSASVKSKYQRDLARIKIEINCLELKVQDGNWLSYEDGSEFKDPKHAFSNDLDIFGKGSVFQLINRTVSIVGKNLLAKTISEGSDQQEINERAISEHSNHMEWNQDFIAEGLMDAETIRDEAPIEQLNTIDYKNKTIIKVFGLAIPILAFVSTVLVSFGFISGFVFSGIIILILGIIGNQIRTTNKMIFSVLNFEKRLLVINKQLIMYRNLKVSDELLKSYQDTLFGDNNTVLFEINSLTKILNRMNFRMNFLVGLLLNFYLAWDFNIRLQMEKWMNKNSTNLKIWEQYMANIELWISGATFKFNYPNSTFAKFNHENNIQIENLKHPFIAHQKTVNNSLIFDKETQFQIITGPNMAGKSTFLRSYGLVFVLANAGFPILAENVNIPHMRLYTSMRTTDDLQVESSYFHAELMRLRFIVDQIENGEKVFVILDEILKGTNSKDKEIGSARFLKKLKKLNTHGLIATHDLSLCQLANEDKAFNNIYFDSIIQGDSIHFDYICRQGICQNMNASFLLKRMKLTDEE